MDSVLTVGRYSRRTPSPPESLPSDMTARGSRPTDPPDPAVLDAIEAKLVQHVGPIARILLKQELQSFKSLPQLYHALAEHISDDAERAAFLNLARPG